jgi:phosphatidate cytidylyltransferase
MNSTAENVGMAPPVAEKFGQDLRLRVLSAAVMASVALGMLYLGNWPFAGFVALVALAMALEWDRLTGGAGGAGAGALALVPVVAVGLTAAGAPLWAVAWSVAGAAVLAMLAPALGRQRLWPALGALWLALPCVALVWLRGVEGNGLLLALGLLLVVWACDCAAYFTGRGFGGPRLAPRLSPGKTWTGLAGGAVGSALVAGLWSHGSGLASPLSAAVAGAMLAVVAQGGDIAESAVKRRFGAKDSGRLIPGHGGVLDRVDGLLFAAPAAAGLTLLWGGNSA